MNIRLATIADLPAILSLERGSPAGAHWTREQYALMLESHGKDPAARLVLVIESKLVENKVIDDENKLIDDENKFIEDTHVPPGKDSRTTSNLLGFLVARHTEPEWEVENIVVAEPVRRRGLGAQLLRDLITRARGASAQVLFLEVRESNHAARAFYRKWGFKETGRRKGYYNGPTEDAILCHLSLS